MAYNINIEKLPGQSFIKIIELDNTFVGTENYMGFAFFWAYEYRHYLRPQRPHILRKIHNAFLAEGLELSGESERHLQIITKYFNPKLD